MHRAYAALDVKNVGQERDFVLIEGIASTPTADRYGDSVNPTGAKFKLPIPLLLNHLFTSPIGVVTDARPTKDGIPFQARLPIVKEQGVLKDRVDEAIHSLKYRLMNFVSIGFQPQSDAMCGIADGGIRFDEWEWLELSICTIPANPEAVISSVKALDSNGLLTPAAIAQIKSYESAHASAGSTRELVEPAADVSGRTERAAVQLIKPITRKPQFIRIITSKE